MKQYFAGIEGGGTKFNILIANSPADIYSEVRVPTTTPEETIPQIGHYFQEIQTNEKIKIRAVGIGCFGPLDLNPHSATFGCILSTPKKGWRNFDLFGRLKAISQVETYIDTDVNCAALGEGRWGTAQNLSNFIYLTIGTGIGGGIVANSKPIHGMMHPEMGHIYIPHDLRSDPFKGICPYHGDCFEGLASGPAIEKRWGKPASELPADHPAWELEATYIAYALAAYTFTVSPQKIILGGGVMQQGHLFELIRLKLTRIINKYLPVGNLEHSMGEFVTPAALGGRSGSLGAIALAEENYQENQNELPIKHE